MTSAGTTVWHGYQATWEMARGYPGAFGHRLNAPYVFLPLCALFLIGLADWRRPWRVANLDLLVLLGFGVSNVFFNRGEIGVSVPLQYPVLAYLLGRALWIGLRGRGEGLRPVWPASWLLIAALFLLGFRAGLDVADSGVIDVGYAGVVGADRVSHGEALYGNFPKKIEQGDTYGPANYLAYVPFEAVWTWHGRWDDLPAAHAAALLFDLAAFGFLILLGLRIRPGPEGRKLAATLAFGWAAYPYTAYALESNANDTLVAALLLATLLVLGRPAARGATLALASLTKFAPLVLAPVLATYRSPAHHQRPRSSSTLRTSAVFATAFLAVSTLLLLWPAIDPGLGTFWERTIGYQAGRDSPFSIWGQVPSLEPLRIAILIGTGALATALAFWPKRKTLAQVAALSTALLIGLQLAAQHWFYLYIVWFYPLLLIAMASCSARPKDTGEDKGGDISRIRAQQFGDRWEHYVYQQFGQTNSTARLRQRQLVLEMSKHDEPLPRTALRMLSPTLVEMYFDKTDKTLTRDINAVTKMDLVRKKPQGYVTNRGVIEAFLPVTAETSDP